MAGGDGRSVAASQPVVAETVVRQPLAPLPGGAYTVRFRVVFKDGHPVGGTIRFSVTAPALATPPAAEAPLDVPASAPADPARSPMAQPARPTLWPDAIVALAVLVFAAVGAIFAFQLAPSRSTSRFRDPN